MKKIHLYHIPAAGIILLALTCCNKGNSNQPTSTPFSQDNVADFIVVSFAVSSSGVESHLTTAENLSMKSYTPGVVIDSSYHAVGNDPVNNSQFDYQIHYQYGINTNTPPWFNFSYQSNGNVSTPLLSSSGSDSGSFIIQGIENTSGEWVITASGTTSGTHTSKQYHLNFTATLQYNLSEGVSKWDHTEVYGSAAITVTGTGPSNEPFSYSGLLTFDTGGSQHTADLLLNGVHYRVNLQTGTIVKV